MSRTFRNAIVVLLFASASLPAQVGFGLRGGVALTDIVHGNGLGTIPANLSSGKGSLVIGPMLDLRLPAGIGVEADLLYRRYDLKSSSGSVIASGQSGWEIPLLLKYRLPGIIARPYVDGGVNFQRLGDLKNFLASGKTDANRTGFAFGGGVDVKLLVIHVQPEIRYSRFGSAGGIGGLKANNQLDFLVGLSF